jgi:RNA-directed DNA polymerase
MGEKCHDLSGFVSLPSTMHGHEKSDSVIVAVKPANKVAQLAAEQSAVGAAAAEPVEPRAETKGNVFQPNTCRAQHRISVPQALERIRKVARERKKERFTALLHHIDTDLLEEAFLELKRDAAPGVDGVTWKDYEADLERNLEDLHERVQRGAYRARPSRRVYIPKADGRQRPLAVAALEDKLVQRAVVTLLNAIYEEDFLGISYGFRPGRGTHDALDALCVGIRSKKVSFILDADIRSFLRHDRLLAKVAKRVDDNDVMHLLKIMLKANGRCGVPQGGVISPLLSNLYLTEVDQMLERAKEVTRSGKYTYIEYARFADDLVILIDAYSQHDWLLPAVEKRVREELAALQVEINEEKSRIVDLGRGESFGFPGFDFRRIRSQRGVWRANLHAKAQETHGAATEAQGRVSPLPIPTSGSSDRLDQSGATRLGELLRGRARQRVLSLH